MAQPKRRQNKGEQQRSQQRKDDRQEGEAHRRGGKPKPNPIEWAVGVVSALLVVAMIGFVLYHGISGNVAPEAALRAIAGSVEETADGKYRVRFRVVNDGNRTASGVTVVGELRSEGQAVEASEVQIDYVPARSEHRGALLFTQDPRGMELRLRTTGYRDP